MATKLRFVNLSDSVRSFGKIRNKIRFHPQQGNVGETGGENVGETGGENVGETGGENGGETGGENAFEVVSRSKSVPHNHNLQLWYLP